MLREPISPLVAKMPASRNYSTPVRAKSNSASLTTITLQLRNASPLSSPGTNNNESMDSGVAGLRDGLTTPHGGSPTSAASSTASSSGSGALHHKPGPAASPAKYPVLPLLKPSSAPQQPADGSSSEQRYIYDRSTRKTYYKDKFLGKGGFARVYELTDLTTGHIYAGKIIPKSRITKPHHKEKITREIELHRNLVHENVVRFFHCFEDEENVYIILENCSKRSLVHVMKHRKTLTEPEVRFYLRQLADGLRYVHAARIVHRDLKLGNMFLSEDMTVKIGDFGLAARLNADAKVTICGTPNYIAPEVLSRQGHGYEADIWAMGCIMFAMLVGQPPFETSSLNETYARISQNLYVIPQWVSRPARSLIRQLLAPDPRHRPTLDQVISHEFFSSGLMPASLPGSCCSKAPVFAPNDSGIKSDCDSTNENASPVTNHLRAPSVMSPGSASNRSRPESSVKLLQVDNKDRVGRSHSLKETPASRKEKKTVASTPLPKSSASTVALSTSALKQKMTQVLCLDRHDAKDAKNGPAGARPGAGKAPSLFAALDSCLYHAPQGAANPCPMPCQPLFISKWIDYSNRYGFGFQLSDRSVGVLFNDSTRISYSGDRSRLDFQDASGKTSSYSTSALPGYLTERLTLLRYFAQYMDENLTEGGDSQGAPASPAARRDSPVSSASFVHMKRWVRTPKAIIMQLDNNTLQINFFKDHTKIVLSSSADPSGAAHFWVTYINSERLSSTYRLSDIAAVGCEATLRERLVYALTVLREFEELDADNNNKM